MNRNAGRAQPHGVSEKAEAINLEIADAQAMQNSEVVALVRGLI